ncbi:hypothetical protein BDV97DRAFT_419274 [Delphinella strobiligena]|nr:hypothetical protein BDV97DRAFT_419274 [Delphinella strobiligena]
MHASISPGAQATIFASQTTTVSQIKTPKPPNNYTINRATRNTQHATSNKQQATSNKQQATSNKQQATSNKQQATSNKQHKHKHGILHLLPRFRTPFQMPLHRHQQTQHQQHRQHDHQSLAHGADLEYGRE